MTLICPFCKGLRKPSPLCPVCLGEGSYVPRGYDAPPPQKEEPKKEKAALAG